MECNKKKSNPSFTVRYYKRKDFLTRKFLLVYSLQSCKFQFVTLYLLFYHNSESVEIACFLSRFPTFRIYGTGGHLGVDLG